MITQQERALINKFITKDKQERYLTFLAKDKTRNKFLDELYHFNDFNWKLFREIPGNENEGQIVALKVKSNKNITTCLVISTDHEYDGKFMSVDEAIENVIGIEGTILIFGDADIVYYEGEAPKNRYISI
jgi:hypothetical protein